MKKTTRFAIGNDVVFVPAFKKSFSPLFKKRVFTEREIKQIEAYKANPIIRYASTWGAKEAVIKALRQLFGNRLGLAWKGIEIYRSGKIPIVIISDQRFKNVAFSLSLSHHQDYAFAVTLAYIV